MINNNAKPAAAQRHHDDCDHLDAGKMGVSLLAILAMTLLTMRVVLVWVRERLARLSVTAVLETSPPIKPVMRVPLRVPMIFETT